MKIIIPMAGLGSRFSSVGYSVPKPLISIEGKPMIQLVVEHLGLTDHCEHIFLCQKSHVAEYDLHSVFSKFVPDYKIVEIDGATNGAASTVSMASSAVDDNDEVMIVNSDQLIFWDKDIYSYTDAGTIYCFYGEGPKWSYARVDNRCYVLEVAEKKQISEHATSGMYHWKRFGDFLDAYRKMVAANDRVNNEFYVAPVYNYALDKGITIRHIDEVIQVGTPEELDEYLLRLSRNN